jgi:glycosyltransferase involved in cell wall biosynthesis
VHVAIICCEYPPAPHGGTGSSYRDLAEGLVSVGHAATVVGVYPAKLLKHGQATDENINGLRVVRLPAAPGWLRYRLGALWDRFKLRRWLAREHAKTPFDLVETSDYAGWLRFGGPRGVPTVMRIRGSNLFFDTELQRAGDAFEHGLERTALARADHIASVSRYAAQRTLEICGLAQRPCSVIPNAVDTAMFSQAAQPATEPGLIIFVNSINPKKGIEQLIGAMNIVCRAHPTARLVVIGEDTQKSSEGRSYVEQLTAQVSPEFRSRVVFTGRLPRAEIIPWLRRAHVCCYPSHMETFGIAVIEAMAVGKPVIFSRTGPGPELIEDGVSGLLCDPYSAADIAAKIQAILENPQFADTLGQSARRRVEQTFDKRDWVRRNLEFYETVCARKPAQR